MHLKDLLVQFEIAYIQVIREQVSSGVHVARSLVFCVMFCRLLFVLLSSFYLAVALSDLLRFMASDCSFSIFKHEQSILKWLILLSRHPGILLLKEVKPEDILRFYLYFNGKFEFYMLIILNKIIVYNLKKNKIEFWIGLHKPQLVSIKL